MQKINLSVLTAALLAGVSSMSMTAAAQSGGTPATSTFINTLNGAGAYLTGDKHNHNTCTDGSVSTFALVNTAVVTYDLDWFANAGHGGSGNRDCRFSDPEGDASATIRPGTTAAPLTLNNQGEGMLWSNTIGNAAILGTQSPASPPVVDGVPIRNMWRWQNIQQFDHPMTAAARALVTANHATGVLPAPFSQVKKAIWTGLEWVNPGHEHTTMGIIDGQFPAAAYAGDPAYGNANGVANFEFCFDRNDGDLTNASGFTCPSPTPGEVKNTVNSGNAANPLAGHEKSRQAVRWVRQNFPYTGYIIPAHLERAGAFGGAQGNFGFNIEHLRNFYNDGLMVPGDITKGSIFYGMESQPGHQAANTRGEYAANRGNNASAGLTTYGGTGIYAAGIASLPGFDTDGNPLNQAALSTLYGVPAAATANRVVLGAAGVGGVWDALLGEGRRFFTFASSDWHNRGIFGPYERSSTQDFWPGEMQKTYVYVPTNFTSIPNVSNLAGALIAGERSGNAFYVTGDLIDQLNFVACYKGVCANMGQELPVSRAGGGNIEFELRVRDPQGENFSPYTFNNPTLLQVGINEPLNTPSLRTVDIIAGQITGEIQPSDPRYSRSNTNPTTRIFASFNPANWVDGGNGVRIMRWQVPVANMTRSMYFRARGNNHPAGTPNETDSRNNPLSDALAINVTCPFVKPPASLPSVAAGTELENAESGLLKFIDFNRRTGASNPAQPTDNKDNFDPASCPNYLPVDAQGNHLLDYDVEGWSDLNFYANPIFVKLNP